MASPQSGLGDLLQQHVEGLTLVGVEGVQQVVRDALSGLVGVAEEGPAVLGQDDDPAAAVVGEGRRSAKPSFSRSSTRPTIALGS